MIPPTPLSLPHRNAFENLAAARVYCCSGGGGGGRPPHITSIRTRDEETNNRDARRRSRGIWQNNSKQEDYADEIYQKL